MDDLISRQAAIDAIEAYFGDLPIVVHYDMLQLIKKLPSAERLGRWVDGRRMGLDGTFHWFRQCSECLHEREDDNEDKDTPYCPNCGARMEGEEE